MEHQTNDIENLIFVNLVFILLFTFIYIFH